MCVGRRALCRLVWGQRVHHMVPRGLEPRTLRLLAVRSDQLSYETSDCTQQLKYSCVVLLAELRLRQVPCGARIRISREALHPAVPRPGAITWCGRIVA